MAGDIDRPGRNDTALDAALLVISPIRSVNLPVVGDDSWASRTFPVANAQAGHCLLDT
jgi:hypothetical protein